MRSASQQSLKEFYGVLEKTARFGKVLNYESLQDGLSEDDYFVVMIELSILRGDILNVLTDKQNKDFKEKLGCYIKERLTITKNTFLIARYNQTPAVIEYQDL